MARPLRIMFPGACYHVTARGNGRERIYRDDRDRQIFLARLEAMVQRYDLVLHAYVLMRSRSRDSCGASDRCQWCSRR